MCYIRKKKIHGNNSNDKRASADGAKYKNMFACRSGQVYNLFSFHLYLTSKTFLWLKISLHRRPGKEKDNTSLHSATFQSSRT